MHNMVDFVVVTYRSTGQVANEFSNFQLNLEKLFKQFKYLKSSFTVVLIDFIVLLKSC